MTEEKFSSREIPITCFAGFMGGVIGSGLTNSLEAVTVAKQTNPATNIWELVKKERFSLFTKGLLPRIYYNGA